MARHARPRTRRALRIAYDALVLELLAERYARLVAEDELSATKAAVQELTAERDQARAELGVARWEAELANELVPHADPHVLLIADEVASLRRTIELQSEELAVAVHRVAAMNFVLDPCETTEGSVGARHD